MRGERREGRGEMRSAIWPCSVCPSSFILHPLSLRSRGFVFLAALGVMAVAFLIVLAMSGTTRFAYHSTGTTLGEVQEQIMARSAADYACFLVAQKKMPADGTASFTIVTDTILYDVTKGKQGACTGTATVVLPEQQLYQSLGLVPRAGDILIHVVSPQMLERYGRGERRLLCNYAGQRLRPIDVTVAHRVR